MGGNIVSKKLTIVDGAAGDWSALYVDGKEYYQGHNIPLHILADVVDNLELIQESDDNSYTEKKGCFPDKLKDIPKECLEEV
jgi:hypothetical protein